MVHLARKSLQRFVETVMQRTRKVSGVNALRLTWSVTVVWYEVGVFHWSVARCKWPDKTFVYENPKKAATSPSHVIIIADPQVLDDNSYPEKGYVLGMLSRVIVDLNTRKSWRAVRRLLLRRNRKREGDAVVFLGDMMDNGRSDYSDSEYEAYFDRFKSIFATDASTEVYYIPGNHDVGLGSSRKFSPHSRSRYIKHFGPLNRSIYSGNHTLVMVDAPGLVEEDYRRSAAGQRFEDWRPAAGGAVDFVNGLASGSPEPVILFSHIPLFRPDTSHCGPLRERGTIRRGVGFGYQNTLGRQTSEFLLNNIRPSVIFSGDDHDYCEYIHSVSRPYEGSEPKLEYVREVTVKSFSMAMGVHNPGFQLLSLADPSSIVPGTPSHTDVPCFLPDQIAIYLNRYLPLFILSLCILMLSVFRRLHNPRRNVGHYNFDVGPNDISLAECSPESVFPGSLSSARSLPSSGNGVAAPSHRVASATFPPSPFTHEFTAMPGGRTVTPGILTAEPAGLNISPGDAELGYGYRYDGIHQDGEPQFVERRGHDGAFFAPTLARAPNRKRRLVWFWTFVMAGRRRRITIGIPPFLERILTVPVSFFRRGTYFRLVGGRGGGKKRKCHYVGHRSPVRMFTDEFLSTAWPPFILFAFINLYILYP